MPHTNAEEQMPRLKLKHWHGGQAKSHA